MRPCHGLLFLCLVPSTVQSSIAFTSIARGNVSAALISASLSNIVGVALTPLLVVVLMNTSGHARMDATAIRDIVLQLLLPFRLGYPACAADQSRRSRIDPGGRVRGVLDGHGGRHLVFFPAATVAVIMLPLMIFHQIQLVVCSLIASRLSRDPAPA